MNKIVIMEDYNENIKFQEQYMLFLSYHFKCITL